MRFFQGLSAMSQVLCSMKTFWDRNRRARWLLFGLLACLGLAAAGWQYNQAARQAQLNQDLLDAASANQAVRVQELLRAGADPNIRLPSDTPPPTAWQNMTATVLRLWHHQPPESREVRPTVLQAALASETGSGQAKLETAAALLNAGADPNLPHLLPSEWCSDDAPLVMAVNQSQPQLVGLLLDKHADAAARDPRGTSCLNIAAGGGWYWGQNAQSVALLLAHGADANAPDARGITPLIAATERQISLPVFTLLLKHGASVSAQGPDGETAFLALMTHHRLLDSPETFAVIKLLLAHGANVNACDKRGRTPLMLAAARGQIITSQTLIAFGADKAARDAQGHTAQDWVRENKRALLSPLLKQKMTVLLSR